MLRICERFQRNYQCGESDIYRKFSKEFDDLFQPWNIPNSKEFEQLYVQDKDFEKQLENFISSDTNLIKFSIGYTGIGKTTSIRYMFNLWKGDDVAFDDGRIVFSTFLDGNAMRSEEFDLTDRISAVCVKLEKKYPELKNIMRTVEGKKELYEFILKHNGYTLSGINPIDAMEMDENTYILESLKNAYVEYPYEFCADKLKFYIKKLYGIYHQLIIILDDIESLPELYQGKIITQFAKFHACMLNTDYPEDGNYNVKLLISVRPHTHRLFRYTREIETFFISEPAIIKKDSVDLSSIFLKRFNFYKEKYKKDVGNMETWSACYRELCKMNTQFECKYKDMIKKLCFLNIRDSLVTYAKIFANRLWIQKNKEKEESFTITEIDYSFNNINIIRALACNEEMVYWGDRGTCISNIFLTTREEDFSVCCLLVLEYFSKKRNGECYGTNAETLSEIFKEWEETLESGMVSKMKESMYYLFEIHVLRKSIYDSDDIETMDTRKSLKDDSKLYISPRGDEMLEMFERDSVLLEVLREAAWRDYENRDGYSEYSSYELLKDRKQEFIFKDLLEYIDFLREKEDDVIQSIKNQRNYDMLFGNIPVTGKLLEGVRKSLEYSGYIGAPDMWERYVEIKNRIRTLTGR